MTLRNKVDSFWNYKQPKKNKNSYQWLDAMSSILTWTKRWFVISESLVYKTGAGAGVGAGVGCGVGFGLGLAGGAGFSHGPWNHLRIFSGFGFGCGVGVGFGYGQGLGYGSSWKSIGDALLPVLRLREKKIKIKNRWN
ncbi:hypothetical protein BVRB_2g027300 [Beta vulgaris subsp. vulgaris]|nr:hypothetical protein BVRB_2g027300 [Beta vulgaris subsp. vulgaris]